MNRNPRRLAIPAAAAQFAGAAHARARSADDLIGSCIGDPSSGSLDGSSKLGVNDDYTHDGYINRRSTGF